ncbi:hypothetical protein [Pollutimonas harenae]|uniref:Uncharacterized protein n=1 Tax=Pollutimonas harenae TaxID=657015 RepID=A0A853GWA6_9BURK|nr:hypothetical protein [Pollutimonas harenae]NYT84422.1 hypothetical protein [Pollutimonas harenae]TEA73177.1 hypothetical protein ERD84_04515 [Pollutimonas harenae]
MANIKLALAGNGPVSSVASRAAHNRSVGSRAASAAKSFIAAVNKADNALAGYMADLAKARNQGVVKD